MEDIKSNGNGQHATELAEKPAEVRIVINQAEEIGTTGLKAYGGFVSEAYNSSLFWPGVAPLYSRIRTSMPEIVMVTRAFTAWGRNISPIVELPENPSDDDKRYQDFIFSDFENMEGGFGELIETMVSRVPFDGWFWWDAVPALRAEGWIPPDPEDTWRSQEDDGLIGLRRLSPRDPNSFQRWEFNTKKRMTGMWQQDFPAPAVLLPLSHGLHMTFGDPNNPEGNSPLQAVWRLERIKYGLEVIQGIGFEHAAGHLSVSRTSEGTISDDDRANIKQAARSILTAQEGNYAVWPFGYEGDVMDIGFQAAPSILEAIKHYSILALSVYMMQTIALNTLTNTGALASQVDTTQLAVFTFNSMMDGFAQQYDAQIGRRLYEWNKSSFPGLTRRPKIKFSHVENNIALNTLGGFLSSMKDILPLGEEDLKAIRKRSGFLPENNPEEPITGPGSQSTQPPEIPLTPEQQAQQTADAIRQANNFVGRRPGANQ
jgi:hypothetical protein